MTALPPPLTDLLQEDSSLEETTLQGYRSAWRDLVEWIRENEPGDSYLGETRENDEELLPPPALIAEYLRDRMDLARSTLTTRRQAIQFVYRELGAEAPFDHPDVKEVWSRILDEKRGESSRREKRAQSRDHSPADIIENGPALLKGYLKGHLPSERTLDRDSLKYLPEETARGEELPSRVQSIIPEPTFELPVLRDRAILLLLATTEQPRKSLVGIDIKDILPPEEEGGATRIVICDDAGDPTCVLNLKTGPEVHCCPNRAVAAWVLAAGLETGPLFRRFNPRGGIRGGRIRPQTLNLVTKRRAEEAGFDPDHWSTTTLREETPREETL